MEDMMTIEDLMKMFRLRRKSIYRWNYCNLIPRYRIGKYIRYKKDDVMKYIESRKERKIKDKKHKPDKEDLLKIALSQMEDGVNNL
jgi:predicted DNA-binding transcriptional regulator AlpA